MAGASCVSDVRVVVGLVTAAGAEDELEDEEDICRGKRDGVAVKLARECLERDTDRSCAGWAGS